MTEARRRGFTNGRRPPACGGSSTPQLFGSIADVSGILDHPLSRMMTTEGVIAREAIHRAASKKAKMDCFAEPVIGRAFARPVGFIRATRASIPRNSHKISSSSAILRVRISPVILRSYLQQSCGLVAAQSLSECGEVRQAGILFHRYVLDDTIKRADTTVHPYSTQICNLYGRQPFTIFTTALPFSNSPRSPKCSIDKARLTCRTRSPKL